MTIEDIAQLCKAQSVRWTSHILERMFRRGIRMDEVVSALTNGEIIEQYPIDYPFPKHTFPVPLTGRKISGKGEKHDLFYVQGQCRGGVLYFYR